MLEIKANTQNVNHEIKRLKSLQNKLKDDIVRYKNAISSSGFQGRRTLTEEEQDKLLENFQLRLKQNTWILKKIMFSLKQLTH